MTFYCPVCGSLTHFNQWKDRSAWSSNSMIFGVPQLQVLCTNAGCKKTHVIIPDFLNPYKRYVGAEIEAAIDNGTLGDELYVTEAEESTINRWIRQFKERLPQILSILARLLIIEYENILSLLECSHGLKRLRKMLMLFPYRKAATTFGSVNLELFTGGHLKFF
mgnify:CR=1 FL=1